MSAYLKDLAERTAATFAEAFLAAVVVAQYTDLSMWKAASLAGLTAALTVVKAAIAKKVGNPASASMSPSV
jgi:Putative lactococcus lactis phage r1t holin